LPPQKLTPIQTTIRRGNPLAFLFIFIILHIIISSQENFRKYFKKHLKNMEKKYIIK